MIFSKGERMAQLQFGSAFSNEQGENTLLYQHLVSPHLNEDKVDFIEKCSFLFIATANGQGECDCSFRGVEKGQTQVLRVDDFHTLSLPDFSGNGLYQSLGNLIENPHIGLILIHFDSAERLRINGSVQLLAPTSENLALWPNVQRVLRITIQQSYWNCRQRIRNSFDQQQRNFGEQ